MLTLNDVQSIDIHSRCSNMSPCFHEATITLNDGRTASFGRAYEISAILAHLAKEKISIRGSWNTEEAIAHFRQFSTPNPEWGWDAERADVILTRIFTLSY